MAAAGLAELSFVGDRAVSSCPSPGFLLNSVQTVTLLLGDLMFWVVKIKKENQTPFLPALHSKQDVVLAAWLGYEAAQKVLGRQRAQCLGLCPRSPQRMRQQDPTHGQHLSFCSPKALVFPQGPSAFL